MRLDVLERYGSIFHVPCSTWTQCSQGELIAGSSSGPDETALGSRTEWINAVPQEVLHSLPSSEVNRQTCVLSLTRLSEFR